MQKKKGISLIVLVITIIVMIVLAGAIILSLNNAGIIGKANQAVSSTDEATIKEVAQMAWAEAYADGVRHVETNGEVKGFQDRVDSALKENDADISSYGIIATTKGVEIVKGWAQVGTIVRKGNTTINVGELVAYDETKDGTVAVDKNVTWKVLGAKDGELLIMSADNIVDTYYISNLKDEPAKINVTCQAYGKGVGAVSSRCINVDDVNRITGYNPETAGYEKGTIEEYGNKVTYIWNGSSNPYYISSNNDEEGLLSKEHNGSFTYYNGKELITSKNEGATIENPNTIVTLMNDIYTYYGTTLTDNLEDEHKGLAEDSEAYKMLFKNSINTEDVNYWLASQMVYASQRNARFGLRMVAGGAVGANGLMSYSDGHNYRLYHGVRAVISLGTDIIFTGKTDEGLTF